MEKLNKQFLEEIINGNLANVELLLKAGADVNFGNSLYTASKSGHVDIVRLLLNNKADINLQNKDGKTAYDLAQTDEIKNLLKENKKEHTLIIRHENEVIMSHQITKDITINI